MTDVPEFSNSYIGCMYDIRLLRYIALVKHYLHKFGYQLVMFNFKTQG